MLKKKRILIEHIGVWAFIGGTLLAILISGSPLSDRESVRIILAILGIAVGLLNIRDVEIDRFLIAAISLIVLSYVVASVFNDLPLIGPVLLGIYKNFVSFVGPAAVIVAVKVLLNVASEK